MSKRNKSGKGQVSGGSHASSSVEPGELVEQKSSLDRLTLENQELRERLQPYLDVAEKAERDAEAWIALVKDDEANLRAEYRRQEDQKAQDILNTAQERAEQLVREAAANAELRRLTCIIREAAVEWFWGGEIAAKMVATA